MSPMVNLVLAERVLKEPGQKGKQTRRAWGMDAPRTPGKFEATEQ
jgi:hypothetical protein